MTYRLGIDVGSTHTTWATVVGNADGAVDSGSIESALGVAADGQLVGGGALAGATTLVRDFVPRLGDSAPIIVGGTPYGAEALVARLVSTVLDTARTRHGGDPLAVVMVHDDGLDPYRTGLLAEAARLAGVAPAATVLLSRSDAATAGGGASMAAGAAKAGWSRIPDPVVPAAGGAGGVALGAAGGVAAAGAGVAAAASMLGDGAATASAAAPVVSAAGPAGTPLAPAGPTGAPLQPAGPTGTPLQPPAGGPTGAPLPGSTPPPVSVTSGLGVPKPRIPKWVTITAGAVIVAAIGVTVAVVASGDDSKSVTLGSSGQVADTTGAAVTSGGTDAAGATETTAGGTAGGETFDLTPILGEWIQPCEPYIAGDGASHGTMTVQSPGTNQLSLVIGGGDFTTADCTGDYTETIAVTYPLTVVGAGTSGDVQGFLVQPAGDPTCVSPEQGACDLAMSMGGSAVPPAIGVDASGQLVAGDAGAVDANGLPTSWTPMVEGAVRS